MDVDRRGLLKRASALGAVAWVAPTVLAAPAVAQEAVCTPSCQPSSPQGNVEVLVTGYCPGPGRKGARVNLRLAPSAPPCPCSEVPPRLCRGAIPVLWEKDGTGQIVTVGPATPAAGYDLAFYVAKPSGALGNGQWVPLNPIRVYLQCADDTGDVATSYCDYRPTFTFRDAGQCGFVAGFQPGLVTCGFEDCNFTPEFCV